MRPLPKSGVRVAVAPFPKVSRADPWYRQRKRLFLSRSTPAPWGDQTRRPRGSAPVLLHPANAPRIVRFEACSRAAMPPRQAVSANAPAYDPDPFAEFRRTEARYEPQASVIAMRGDRGMVIVDENALRALATWQSVIVEWEPPPVELLPPQPREGLLWRWVWEGCSVNGDDLDTFLDWAQLSGLAMADCRIAFRKLVAAHLIYPDGTVSEFAERLLRLVADELAMPTAFKKGAA